ncbi:hypothetical protein Taro_037320 [Colocasia esculenta]|uniref:Uncharacterized protein n=1 Tax=Colocasia esculenta TaxID=4460 RepID=A0A843WKH5_COLES|nr:hypothetical protein [Colocasia esculenta]
MAAPIQPSQPQEGRHGGHVINLPVQYNIRGIPDIEAEDVELLTMHNMTPKYHGSLNTLHQTLGDEFTSYWGCVEEFLAAGGAGDPTPSCSSSPSRLLRPAQTVHLKSTKGADPVNETTR